MFKNGDYVVKLNDASSCYLLKNHVYVQSTDKNVLITDYDSFGTTTMSSNVYFNSPVTWRYATPEEIAEYERLGKPFDVTTVVSVPVNNDYAYLVKFLKKLGIK
jgi:hypothetical protein